MSEHLTPQHRQAQPEAETPAAEGRVLAPPRFQVFADGDGDAAGGGAGEGSGSAAVVQRQEGAAPVIENARETSLHGSPAAWDEFAITFNTRFQSVLHSFYPDVEPLLVGKEERTGDSLSGAQLATMFSDAQRILLIQFFESNVIPDHLFNGDEPQAGDPAVTLGLSAQQRILLSAIILERGTYKPGGEMQDLHARMCYHWVQLVHHYAGATRLTSRGGGNSAAGIMGNFDHAGNAVFGTGTIESTYTGALTRFDEMPEFGIEGADHGTSVTAQNDAAMAAYEDGDAEALHRFGRREGMSMEQINLLEPGDWIMYFVGNSSGIGSHSVIFSHFASGVQHNAGGAYRRAVCFSQGHPEDGGSQHEANLGPVFSPAPFHIYTVVSMSRMGAGAHTARNLDEMLTGGRDLQDPESGNREFVQTIEARRECRGQHVDLEAIRNSLRTEVQGYLDTLSGTEEEIAQDRYGAHLSAGQRSTFQAGLASGSLETLVQMYERLRPMAANADLLDADVSAATARVDGRRAALHNQYEAGMTQLCTDAATLEEQIRPMVEALVTNVRQLHRSLPPSDNPRTQFRHEELASGANELERLQGELDDLTPRSSSFWDLRSQRSEMIALLRRRVRDMRRLPDEAEPYQLAIRRIQNMAPGYVTQLNRQARQGERLAESMPFHTAHAPGTGGRGESNPPVTGLLRNVYGVQRILRDFLADGPAQVETPSPRVAEPPQ